MQFKGYQLSIFLVVGGLLLLASALKGLLLETQVVVLPVKFSLAQPTLVAVKKDDQCLFAVTVAWKQQPEGSSIFVTGTLPGESDEHIPLFKGELSFNQFDQFFGSVIEFSKISQTAGRYLKIGSQGVNPIRLIVSGQVFEKPLSLELHIPGPMMLIKVKDFGWLSVPKSQREHIPNVSTGFDPTQLKIETIETVNECVAGEGLNVSMPEAFKTLSNIVNRARGE